jgi:hypothetical protein
MSIELSFTIRKEGLQNYTDKNKKTGGVFGGMSVTDDLVPDSDTDYDLDDGSSSVSRVEEMAKINPPTPLKKDFHPKKVTVYSIV